jgi:glutaredoxin-related protein
MGCLYREKKLVKNIQSSILDHIYQKEIQHYWHHKDRIASDQFEQVNWTAMGQAMKGSTTAKRIWVTKRAVQECGANAVLFRRKQKETDKCSFCGEIESVLHVYHCTHNAVNTTWRAAIEEFRKDLERFGTDPTIITQMCIGLTAWREGNNNEGSWILRQQNCIGWNGILEGCLSIHWQNLQSIYYNNRSVKKSGLK